jgi:hypothetical protein
MLHKVYPPPLSTSFFLPFTVTSLDVTLVTIQPCYLQQITECYLTGSLRLALTISSLSLSFMHFYYLQYLFLHSFPFLRLPPLSACLKESSGASVTAASYNSFDFLVDVWPAPTWKRPQPTPSEGVGDPERDKKPGGMTTAYVYQDNRS